MSGAVLAEQPRNQVRRSGRDWVVDIACVFLSLAVGAWFLALLADDPSQPSQRMLALDAGLGLIACAAVWFRRRFPVWVGVLTALISIVSVSSAMPATIAMFTVAVHRRSTTAVAIGLLNVVATALFFALHPQNVVLRGDDVPLWVTVLTMSAILAAIVAWGMLVRARRQLVQSLRERAERAEGEQRLLAEQARQAERTRIAREMHDVVAHRVSLLALHAGALEVRPDLSADEVGQTARLIRATARQALEELRDVIGVLRQDGSDEAEPQAPQPTLADIARLVEDSRRAGASIDFDLSVRDPPAAPGALGRDAYRIVQEALTNVNKHAPGTATKVTIAGAAGRGLQVTVRNKLPLSAMTAPAMPGSGTGLVGLAERVALSGGSLRHGATEDGDFCVHADLRWPG